VPWPADGAAECAGTRGWILVEPDGSGGAGLAVEFGGSFGVGDYAGGAKAGGRGARRVGAHGLGAAGGGATLRFLDYKSTVKAMSDPANFARWSCRTRWFTAGQGWGI